MNTFTRADQTASRDTPAAPARAILVVDDSRAHRRLLCRTLGGWGYETIEAGSGAEALEICRGVEVELVISDWLMPGMTGVEFCRAFRAIKDMRPGYFILLTAQSDRKSLVEGLDSGADDFLSKPFNTVELRARLRAGERVLDAQRDIISKNRLLARALEELRKVHAAIEIDLRGARAFQQALIPERHFDLDGAEVSLLYRPSGHVGGDLAGLFRVTGDRYGLFAIDVAGHGIASALMTARVAGLLTAATPERNIALTVDDTGLYGMIPPEEVCHILNRSLIGDSDLDHYLTMVLADVDLSSGRIVMAQAGHPSPAIQRRNGSVEYLAAPAMPVGLVAQAEFATVEAALGPGERMLIYSDGVTECPGPAGAMFDEDGLTGFLERHRSLRGAELLDRLYDRLRDYSGLGTLPDDVSAVLIERAPV